MRTHIFVRGRPLGSIFETCLPTPRVEESRRIKIEIDILEICCNQWNIFSDGYVVVAILKGIDGRDTEQDCLCQHFEDLKAGYSCRS